MLRLACSSQHRSRGRLVSKQVTSVHSIALDQKTPSMLGSAMSISPMMDKDAGDHSSEL